MSYQGWGCSAWLAKWDFIKSIVPEEAKAFEDNCNKISSMDDVAFNISIDDDVEEETMELLNVLADKFYEKTEGLSLELGWIGYDEVDSDIHGGVWFVGGVKEFTPAGEKYAKNLSYERWVEYG